MTLEHSWLAAPADTAHATPPADQEVEARPTRDDGATRAGSPHGLRHLHYDVGRRPFLVLFELTRACDLACRHCRAEAKREPDADELTTAEVRSVLDDLAALGSPRPIVVFTGGDPLTRPDLLELVRHATSSQLTVAISPAGTPRASLPLMRELRDAGVATVSFSLDGASASAHDHFRQTQGSFGWTVAACASARRAGLRVQLNTTVTAKTVFELPEILALALRLGVSLWSVFFLVPAGRGRDLRALSAEDTEDVLEFLYEAATIIPLKTTEAPQYRRVVLSRAVSTSPDPDGRGPLYWGLHRRLESLGLPERGSARRPTTDEPALARRRPPLVVGDGRGVVFVSHRGDVQPSGFLPLVAGNVRDRPLSEIYSDSGLLQSLRDPSRLHGRCGRCEYREPCGGSRSQAFAAGGDPLGEDPRCPYVASEASDDLGGGTPTGSGALARTAR
ncbi:MAG TPA: TIGR04053 family radical SAM/SPASM domain-containing protein [Acidimicrobiales bacterium]|nr:TIGR04053 family radical SAM/SPASM domain-containing protein [Acidimicrobiales bacterium]